VECSIEDCTNGRKYIETGWCQTHYHRYWRTGTTDLVDREVRTDLTYYGAHGRVKRTFGSATKHACIVCGNPSAEWAYDGTDPTERIEYMQGRYKVSYSVWPEFYMPMCYPCHRAMDHGAWALRRARCANGHDMTEENTYTRPSRPGTRECKACRAEQSRVRYLNRVEQGSV
jgi:hypothetical protein